MADIRKDHNWFVGRAKVMMTFAHNERYDKARQMAVELDTWLDDNTRRHTDGMPDDFREARGYVDAILEHWP